MQIQFKDLVIYNLHKRISKIENILNLFREENTQKPSFQLTHFMKNQL